ncbi:MAG: zinc ribbon domain-containing protein [Eubacterium sp.]|nr:zinc ribbon domain-containing protein [Eubacterium sp.]
MTCKNCGAVLGENAKVCKNCGAFVEDSSGYVLLTSDDRYDDYYSTPEKEKKKHPVRNFIIFLLIIAIFGGGGTYLYVTRLDAMLHKPPKVSFETGSGYIDAGDEVIFITLDNKDIEYIQGVSLYENDPKSDKKQSPLSTSYEYTKNVDDTFRTILFYTKDLKLDEKKSYKYYYQIKLSFKNDKRIYTYVEPIEFSGDIKNDAGDKVFDHSMYK